MRQAIEFVLPPGESLSIRVAFAWPVTVFENRVQQLKKRKKSCFSILKKT